MRVNTRKNQRRRVTSTLEVKTWEAARRVAKIGMNWRKKLPEVSDALLEMCDLFLVTKPGVVFTKLYDVYCQPILTLRLV